MMKPQMTKTSRKGASAHDMTLRRENRGLLSGLANKMSFPEAIISNLFRLCGFERCRRHLNRGQGEMKYRSISIRFLLPAARLLEWKGFPFLHARAACMRVPVSPRPGRLSC